MTRTLHLNSNVRRMDGFNVVGLDKLSQAVFEDDLSDVTEVIFDAHEYRFREGLFTMLLGKLPKLERLVVIYITIKSGNEFRPLFYSPTFQTLELRECIIWPYTDFLHELEQSHVRTLVLHDTDFGAADTKPTLFSIMCMRAPYIALEKTIRAATNLQVVRLTTEDPHKQLVRAVKPKNPTSHFFVLLASLYHFDRLGIAKLPKELIRVLRNYIVMDAEPLIGEPQHLS